MARSLTGNDNPGGASLDNSTHPTNTPPDIDPNSPLAANWNQPVSRIADLDPRLVEPELNDAKVCERHRIFSLLLMKLICRFWNGNNKGPVGNYPYRSNQIQPHSSPARYIGDVVATPDKYRINWDRYLGHNIACLAVDARGEIMDFDFNHNNVFRSSAEHAEARMVRRLFSLSNIYDSWAIGATIPGKAQGFSLQEVTIYTSLESCAQCSGMMALGRVKQVIYLQSDPGQYRIGNIMHNLAALNPNGRPDAPLPISGDVVGLNCVKDLVNAYRTFKNTVEGAKQNRRVAGAYFLPANSLTMADADFDSSITSFLCTDAALDIFKRGESEFDVLQLKNPNFRPPVASAAAPVATSGAASRAPLTNDECLIEARNFYRYADIHGFRGSPHKP